MKILFIGGEKNYAQNLKTWISAVEGNSALAWDKFYPTGNALNCDQCPMTDPDVVLCFENYVAYEDLEAMGITTKPKRIHYRLANKTYSPLLRDEERVICSDHHASYNPEHKDDWTQTSLTNKFANLKALPLPLDFSNITPIDYSQSQLKIYCAKSKAAIQARSPKGIIQIGQACKQNQVPLHYLRGMDKSDYDIARNNHPIFFDNWAGGIWGANTYEAMALGQAVICRTSTAVLDYYETMMGARPPILAVQTIPQLVQLVADLKSGVIDWKQKCVESRQFIEQHYSPSKIAQIYLNYFQTILGG